MQVKKENPDLAFGEVGKRLGELWKEVSASEKAKFEELAKKDKVRAPVTALLASMHCSACVIHLCSTCTQGGMHQHTWLVVKCSMS